MSPKGCLGKRRFVVIGLAILLVVIVAGAVACALSGVSVVNLARLPFRFPARSLAHEADTMNDCLDCHEPDKFHDCQTCHDDHGSAELASVPFDDLLLLSGDVPEPNYIPINDILPYRDQPNTHIGLLDFLAAHKVTDFESVTLASRDEGLITLERANLTAGSLLLPHVDGLRFADENLHVSTWLKGVWRVIVVGADKPLRIDGQATSIGRLLLGPTQSVTIEQTEVMFKSQDDGQVRKGKTASRIEGAPLSLLVADPAFQTLIARDAAGRETSLTADEARGALLAQVRGQATLVLPGRNRSQWISGVVEIVSQR